MIQELIIEAKRLKKTPLALQLEEIDKTLV
jgi:hypothetical protein